MGGRLWIFDLDNTLHDASPHIFPHINRSMTEFIGRRFGLDESEACALREHYWRRYGATLIGLMRHHRIDPDEFLRDTHQFPDLGRVVVFDNAVKAALRRLPGRKIVFSNAPRRYAEAILAHTGLGPMMDGVYAIEQVGFRPKPDVSGFLRILRYERVRPAHAIMVDDSLGNLVTAKRLGMKTVWIAKTTRHPAWVDTIVPSVLDLACSRARI